MKYPAGRLATQWHLVGLAFTVAVFVQPAQSAPAQPLQEIEWSKPQRLSGLTAEAPEATMVADSRGTFTHFGSNTNQRGSGQQSSMQNSTGQNGQSRMTSMSVRSAIGCVACLPLWMIGINFI